MIRLAVVGGQRGGSFTAALGLLAERARLTAICDLDAEVRARWATEYPGIRTFDDFDALLASDACDAVIIATPMPLHAGQSIGALRAGKHVLSEVAALMTLEEALALIAAVEETGLVYMMAENCCYMRDLAMVTEMARQGAFGAITAAECGYIHDCRSLMFTANGELTWRGRLVRDHNGCLYPTHSIGPVAQWLRAVNPAERFTELTTFAGPARAMQEFAAHHLGVDHPAAQPGYFRCGDSTLTVLRTATGILVTLRLDMVSPRPWNNVAFVLQGTKGAFHRGRHPNDESTAWFEDAKPSMENRFHIDHWRNLWEFADAYEHPLWREWGEAVTQTGHGGSDFFSLLEFSNAVLDGARPAIDVYDAAEWSSIIPLSEQSLAQGSATVAMPDFQGMRINLAR